MTEAMEKDRDRLPERAREVLRRAQVDLGADLEGGSAVDLLLDQLPELVDVEDAQHVLAHLGYVKGEVLP